MGLEKAEPSSQKQEESKFSASRFILFTLAEKPTQSKSYSKCMKSSATAMLYISLADIRKKQDFIARFGPQIRVFSIESCPSKVLEALRF
jgi:hypothetical protein